jgi:hypothetical protein
MQSKYKKSGWWGESARHSLASKGIKTSNKPEYEKLLINLGYNHASKTLRPEYSKMSEAQLKDKMSELYGEAKKMIEGGATPAFHLGAEVGPHVTFMVKDEKDYGKYEVTKDYPFISAQATGISLDKWAEATDVDRGEINIMFLSLNSPVTDLHNASVSLLDADSYEWGAYVEDDWSNVNSMDFGNIKILKKGYEDDELVVVGDEAPHDDFLYYWGDKPIGERYKLAKELISEWKEAEMEARGQKKITNFAKSSCPLHGVAEKKGVTEKDVDPRQLAMGIKVETEHTGSRKVAKKIALDHLAESPLYYKYLAKMEKKLRVD